MLAEEDLLFIYCIMNKIKINWIHIIKEHMQKSMRLSDYHYLYAILSSKFLHYFEVDLDEEQTEVVKSSHEVNNGSLSKMGFTKIGGRWVSKDEDQAGSSSGVQIENEDEEQVAAGGENVGAFDARPSAGNMGERITSMSPFERLMVSRMDARFQNLDEQIKVVQNQLFKLQYGKDD